MNPVLLIDFGSTYTKCVAVDTDAARVLGTAGAHTTVQTDIGDGLNAALEQLTAQTGPLDFAERYACSSAAGGLRMVAVGLVPALTVEAARRAALGAGAKVIRVYSFQLTEEDAAEIASLAPDILLLTGGTDGGNRENIEYNAGMLASVPGAFPVIIAGNRAATATCQKRLSASSHEVLTAENVMPTFGKLNIEPVQAVIREVFLRRIVHAKGLSKQRQLIDGILMPTPAAALSALVLLSNGLPGEPGLGDLMAVDLGGATTDVYSIADGLPQAADTLLRGLPEPHAKRTVEGDIGMRYSARGVVEAAGMERLMALSGLTEDIIQHQLDLIRNDPSVLPEQNDGLSRLDFALAVSAVALGLSRHAGTFETLYTPAGLVRQQTGKDLTGVNTLLLTGGALSYSARAEEIALTAQRDGGGPESLMPRSATPLLDRRYLLSPMGLLAQKHDRAALTILKKEFIK